MNTQSPQYEGINYERYRPAYAKDVAAKLFSLTNYQPPETILEIGCGTGKGTEILIEHGATVHAVEPLVSMGEIAERKFNSEKFTWTACKFEDYQESGRTFPLITSRLVKKSHPWDFFTNSKLRLRQTGRRLRVVSRSYASLHFLSQPSLAGLAGS